MRKTENGKRKTVPYPTPAHAQADRMLGEFAAVRQERVAAEAALAGELERLKGLSPFWAGLEEAYRLYQAQEAAAVKQLQAFEAEHRDALFAPSGEVPDERKTELPAGELIYSIDYAVAKPRKVDVLANIKEYALLEIYGLGDYHGFAAAVKVAEAVHWDLLKTWPPERLLLVGTKKTPKEEFAFELRESAPQEKP